MPTPKPDIAMIEAVKAMKKQGLSIGDISIKLYGNTNHKKTIWRWLRYDVGNLSTDRVLRRQVKKSIVNSR